MISDQLSLGFVEFEEPTKAISRSPQEIEVGNENLVVAYRENRRAKNYLLYLRSDRTVSITIPRRGSKKEGFRFAKSKLKWIERQLRRLDADVLPQKEWKEGTKLLFKGEWVSIHVVEKEGQAGVEFAGHFLPMNSTETNFRPLVESYLQGVARWELPEHLSKMASQLGLTYKRVTIRNQSTRWGSCSSSGAISLNWRLIQVPLEVRDYVLIHELLHLKELNHSKRFWALVENACPDYLRHEEWLKVNAAKLGL